MAENHLEDKFIKHLYVFSERIHLLFCRAFFFPSRCSMQPNPHKPQPDCNTTKCCTGPNHISLLNIHEQTLSVSLNLFLPGAHSFLVLSTALSPSLFSLLLAFLPSLRFCSLILSVFVSICLHKNTPTVSPKDIFLDYFDTIIKPIKANALK